MAAPTIDPDVRPGEDPEVPLLGVFALLIVLAVVAIGVMIAVPTTMTMVVALGTVIGCAVFVSAMLGRMIGE
jgi:hypothetical protein